MQFQEEKVYQEITLTILRKRNLCIPQQKQKDYRQSHVDEQLCGNKCGSECLDKLSLFCVILRFVPSDCPRGGLRTVTKTAQWDCARLLERDMTQRMYTQHAAFT